MSCAQLETDFINSKNTVCSSQVICYPFKTLVFNQHMRYASVKTLYCLVV